MRCAWQAYLNLLPIRMRYEVDKLGKDTLQELRLRLDLPPELITSEGSKWLNDPTTQDDLSFCINAASKYSPWSARSTSYGYITAAGGHRIGLCGEATIINGKMSGITRPTSLCLRVARDFDGISNGAENIKGSVLILGKPGSGKTTLLRCLNFLEKATSGSIEIDGKTILKDGEKLSDKQIRENRLHFGLVFQSFNLFPQFLNYCKKHSFTKFVIVFIKNCYFNCGRANINS